MFAQLMKELGERTKAANPPREGDYIGEDGLLHCGKCHTPKQSDCGKFGILFCACKCEREKYDKDKAAKKEESEAFHRRIETARRYRSCFDDEFYKRMSFENDNGSSQVAIKAAHYYADNFEKLSRRNQGLMFLGTCGVGKTFAACCIANAIIKKGYSVWVITAGELIRKVGNFNTSEDTLARIAGEDLLIIDDFGLQPNSEYTIQTTFDIVDKRYKSAKPLVITSNLTPAIFIGQQENLQLKRIYDRLVEMCMCPISPVVIKGESIRKKIADGKHFEKEANV